MIHRWTSRRTCRMGVFAVLAASLLASGTASAQSSETGFRGRFWVGTVGRYVLTDNATYQAPPFGTVGLEVDGSAVGFGGGIEYKFKRWLGLEGSVGYTSLPVQFQSSVDPGVTQHADYAVVPLYVALNFHVVNTAKVDFWLGPQLAYVIYPDDLAFNVPGVGQFSYLSEDFFSNFGVNLGVDIGVSESWAVNLAFRFQNADGDPNGHLTIDPTFVTVGMTARF